MPRASRRFSRWPALEIDLDVQQAVGLDRFGQQGSVVNAVAQDHHFVLATIGDVNDAARPIAIVGRVAIRTGLVHFEFRNLHHAPDADCDVRMVHEEVIDARVDFKPVRGQLAEHAVAVDDL